MATSQLTLLAEITRPYNTISGVLVFNIAYLLFSSQPAFGANYWIATAVIILAYSWATIENDIADLPIDKINSPDKALASGRLSLKKAQKLSTFLFLWILTLSLYGFPRHLFFVISLIVLSWLYNRPPFYLSRRPFSSLLILALCYAGIPIAYGYSLGTDQPVGLALLILILSWILIRISIAILKDYKDYEGDRQHNKKTFLIRFGHSSTAWVSLACFSLGSAGLLWSLAAYHAISWLFLLPMPFLIINFNTHLQLFRTSDHKQLNVLFHRIFFGQNQFDLALLLCLILSN